MTIEQKCNAWLDENIGKDGASITLTTIRTIAREAYYAGVVAGASSNAVDHDAIAAWNNRNPKPADPVENAIGG